MKKISNTKIKNILFKLTKINTNFILVNSKKIIHLNKMINYKNYQNYLTDCGHLIEA